MGNLAVTVSALLLLFSCTCIAQVLIDETSAIQILQQVNPETGATLQCEITPVAPTLTFTYRFQTGYVARVPFSQFQGRGHSVTVLVRVTPRNQQPVYLLRTFDWPDVHTADYSAELAGAFSVGEGHYQANAVLFDDTHRACRADWQIEMKGAARYRTLLPADTVAPLSDAASWMPTTGAPIERLTIFLHAAPLNPRLLKPQASDVVMTVASLMALLEKLPARSVRLVVFNLQQAEELYRTDFFTVNNLDQVTHALDSLQLQLISYQALQQQQPNQAFLNNLIQREWKEASPAQSVIFLGPDSGFSTKGADPLTVKPPSAQRFFYLQYRMANTALLEQQPQPRTVAEDEHRPPPPCQMVTLAGCHNAIPPLLPSVPPGPPIAKLAPDGIATAVRKAKGKIFVIRNPADFGNAIDKIEGLPKHSGGA